MVVLVLVGVVVSEIDGWQRDALEVGLPLGDPDDLVHGDVVVDVGDAAGRPEDFDAIETVYGMGYRWLEG